MTFSTGLLLDHGSLTIATIKTNHHKTALTYAKQVKLTHPLSHRTSSNCLRSILQPHSINNKIIRIGLSAALFKLTSHTYNPSRVAKPIKNIHNKHPVYSGQYLYTTVTKHNNQQKVISLIINKNLVSQIATFLKEAKLKSAHCELDIFAIDRLLGHPTASTLIITQHQSSYLTTLVKDRVIIDAIQCEHETNQLMQTLLYYKKNYPRLTDVRTCSNKPLSSLQSLTDKFDLFLKPISADWLHSKVHPHILIAAGLAKGERH